MSDAAALDVPEYSDQDGPLCEVCHAPIEWTGRGPRPRYCSEHKRARNRPKADAPEAIAGGVSEADQRLANRAADSLLAGYKLLTVPIAMVHPLAAAEWVAQVPKLDERNREILAATPRLASKITGVAARGGTAAFVLSHVAAVAPVVMAVMKGAQERPSAPAPQTEASDGWPGV